jgi:hypothetical protein
MLEKLEISDNWSRLHMAMLNSISYRLSDDEMIDMLNNLSIQNSPEWDEIKKDPDAVAYYESAYVESLKKWFDLVTACAARQNYSMGKQIICMHPNDLATQMTTETRAFIMSNAVVTNISMDDNMLRLEKFYKKYNKDKRYKFDRREFDVNAAVVGAANMKYTAVGNAMIGSLYETDEESEGVAEAIYGDENYYTNTIVPAYEEYLKAKPDEKRMTNERDIAAWYFIKNPAYFQSGNMNMKLKNGKFAFKEQVNQAGAMFLSGGVGALRYGMEHNMIPMPTDEELDAYEKSLKKRDLPPVRSGEAEKTDTYGLKTIKNKFEDLLDKDEKGVVKINKKTGLEKDKAIYLY